MTFYGDQFLDSIQLSQACRHQRHLTRECRKQKRQEIKGIRNFPAHFRTISGQGGGGA